MVQHGCINIPNIKMQEGMMRKREEKGCEPHNLIHLSHWPELSHWPHLAAKEVSKDNLSWVAMSPNKICITRKDEKIRYCRKLGDSALQCPHSPH